jgi:hypothetical protein
VEEDARTKEGYAQANASAAKLLEAARKSGFTKAAKASGLSIISTGKFNLSYSRDIQNFQHSEEAVRTLMEKAGELLAQASEQNPHPLGLVQIPGERIVLVVELGEVSSLDSTMQSYFKVQKTASDEATLAAPISNSYFAYDAVIKRVDYKASDNGK